LVFSHRIQVGINPDTKILKNEEFIKSSCLKSSLFVIAGKKRLPFGRQAIRNYYQAQKLWNKLIK